MWLLRTIAVSSFFTVSTVFNVGNITNTPTTPDMSKTLMLNSTPIDSYTHLGDYTMTVEGKTIPRSFYRQPGTNIILVAAPTSATLWFNPTNYISNFQFVENTQGSGGRAVGYMRNGVEMVWLKTQINNTTGSGVATFQINDVDTWYIRVKISNEWTATATGQTPWVISQTTKPYAAHAADGTYKQPDWNNDALILDLNIQDHDTNGDDVLTADEVDAANPNIKTGDLAKWPYTNIAFTSTGNHPNFWAKTSADLVNALQVNETWTADLLDESGNKIIGRSVVVRVTATASTEDTQPDNKPLIYPNPISDSFRLVIDGQEITTGITLYDLHGREMQIKTGNDISHLPAGVYVIRHVTDDKKLITQKIIKK